MGILGFGLAAPTRASGRRLPDLIWIMAIVADRRATVAASRR